MKLNKYFIVGILLLTIITIGAASAASENATADDAVAATEDLKVSASDDSKITADGGDVALSSDANTDSKLSAIASDEKLSAGSVAPNYTVKVTPNATDAGNNYIAQYGQVITVSGEIQNASGNVSIRFGYSGNYHDYSIPLVDGKFIKEITDYDRVRNNYQIQVKWAGNDYYKSISYSKNIHVQMANVTANDAYYGMNPYMDVNLFDATGNVTFSLNGRNYTGKLENGKLVQEFTNYTLGKNSVDMIYSGDDRFNPIEKSFTFTVDANVEARKIYNYETAIVTVYMGAATGKVNITLMNGTKAVESYTLDIAGGKVSTEIKNYTVGDNTIAISYSGDETFNPFETTTVLEVIAKEDAEIISSVYQTANQNFIFITIPHANGTINVTLNGKKEVWELVNETVIKEINATDKITELTVSYEGDVRLNPTSSSFYVNLTDYVVNNMTWKHYFNQNDGGRLYDFIEDGVTLDFRGIVVINTDSANEMNIEINKPINIISSTNDAYIDLNCTAGSLLGEHPGSSFVVSRGGSGSNISGIYLHNTELWISNTTNVVFDNISVVVEDQRVGSGVGATSVRDNSSYVTLKNSYFYTRNNGGSTTFTFSWASYCVFDNNTVRAEGNVGNLLYLNVYNIKNLPEPTKTSWGDVLPNYPLNNHNVFSNNELFGKEGSSISVGIMVEGEYNVIANNTLHKCSISTSFGGTGANNNTYYGNILEEGSSLTAQAYSIVYNNIVPASITTGTGSVAYGNTAGTTMTVTASAVAYDNTVGTTMTVAAGSEAYNNTVGALTISGASGIAHDNIINGAVNVNGANGELYGNTITGAVTLKGNNAVAYDNEVTGDITLSGSNVNLTNNNINGVVTVTGANGKVYNNVINSLILNGANAIVANNDLSFSFEKLFSGIMAEGRISGVGAGAEIFNNTVNDISLTGNDITVYDNTISSFTLTGEGGIDLSGDNVVVYNNDIDSASHTNLNGSNMLVYNNVINTNGADLTLPANNVTFYQNEIISNTFIIGEGNGIASVYDNVFPILYEGWEVSVNINGDDVTFYNNNYLGTLTINGNNAVVHDNVIDGNIALNGNDITFKNNNVNTLEEYTVCISANSTNVSVKNNKLHAKEKYGDASVNDISGENIVQGNYPLQNTLTVSADNITVGQVLSVTVSPVRFQTNTFVKVMVNGKTYEGKVGRFGATIKIDDLPVGEYVVIASYDAFGDYGECSNSTVVKVSKLTPTLEMNVTDAVIGGDVNVTATIAGATGNVTFIIDGVENNVELVDGVANYTISNVAAGNHSIVAVYKGDDKNEAAFNSTAFTLEKSTPVVDIALGDLKLGENVNVTVTIADATGKVNIIVDGVENLVDLVNGVATYTIENVTAGVHSIVANYAGDDKYDAAFASTSKELKVLSTTITDITVDGDLNINAVLLDSEGKGVADATISYTIDNLTNTTLTDVNGSFSIKGKENSKVSISFAGSDLLFPTGTVVDLENVAPTRIDSTISASKVTCYAVDYSAGERGKLFKVTLKDANGDAISNETVKVVLNNKVYNIKTDSDGIASMRINLVKAGTYTASIFFLGNDYKNSATKNVKVVVKKKTTKLVAKAKTFKVKAKTKKYTATLKTIKGSSADGKTYLKAGKKVTLTVNKKTYTAKINKKGKVTFNLKKLTKKGKYNAVIKFKGDNTYKGCSKKVKITIK